MDPKRRHKTKNPRQHWARHGFLDYFGLYCMYDWCREPESNRHALRRGILSPVRLPVPPSRQRKLSIMRDFAELSKTHLAFLLKRTCIIARISVSFLSVVATIVETTGHSCVEYIRR
jgi:hypothetical protein